MSRPARRGRPADRRAHIGRLGEDAAADHARSLGWVVLVRNWRNRYGELDLIAADGTTLVVVEVKTRAGRTFDDPVMAVTPAKLSRMRRLTRMWLAEQERCWERIRFDVMAVRLDAHEPEDPGGVRITHHRGVHE
ncbi:YraN family protein [Gordonia paraffinivorans]|uniref:YraN family protein n=1 Tax=Gordonia paraffinivorans TaxID=175628 RepID=UPI001447EFE5|nr:YraN family protein [Gordonia paraffinivorans]